jgi:hypothetical protein
MKRTTALLLLSAACCAATRLEAGAPGVPPEVSGRQALGRQVRAGVAVDLSVEAVAPESPGTPGDTNPGELREGREAVFRFKISDTATGTPLAGSYPAAWIDFDRLGFADASAFSRAFKRWTGASPRGRNA